MSIWSWNCQGVGSDETVQRLKEIRKMHFPELLFLTETKKQCKYLEGLKVEPVYNHLCIVDPIGRSGGLALLWKKSYEVEILMSNKRVIDCKVKLGSLVFYLSCVDPVREHMKKVWDMLTDIGIKVVQYVLIQPSGIFGTLQLTAS